MRHEQQVIRIIEKLQQAKKADPTYQVFGASKHNYELSEPAVKSEIAEFENRYNITLPDCYKSFVLHIGNGAKNSQNSGAGPFYGIYPVGKSIHDLCDQPENSLQNPVILHPEMTNKDWEEIIRKIEDDDDISDEDYDLELEKIFGGILPIGSQGCTYLHGILLNGPHKGKIVNLDLDLQRPIFCYEENFLDWYERWLDEVISGDLFDSASWFGYNRGGSVKQLIEGFLKTNGEEKMSYLAGLSCKSKLDNLAYEVLENEYLQTTEIQMKKKMLQLLYKTNSDKTKNHLIEYGKTDLIAVFEFIFWYSKDKSREWFPYIKSNIYRVEDEKTLRFCKYVLTETGLNFGALFLPFINNKNPIIKEMAFLTLSECKNKIDYLDTFIEGLSDESNEIVRISLQALTGIEHPSLLRAYKKLVDRFPEEKDYILVNLNNRLKEIGLHEQQLRAMSTKQVEQLIKKQKGPSLFNFWKKF